MDTLRNYLPPLAGAALIFPAGAFVGARWFAPALPWRHYAEKTIVEKPTDVQGKTGKDGNPNRLCAQRDDRRQIDRLGDRQGSRGDEAGEYRP